MGIHTKKFINNLEQKITFCLGKVLRSLQYDEKHTSNQVIQNIINDINIMMSLIEVYMVIEEESIKELKHLHTQLIETRSYIETEYERLQVSS
ncbi:MULTISPECIES: hypothetical protein [unclassified Bacillus (in: firmicutes)]|uniref:hypothetical protein n=1 Tax=unclassified Bacillus (in: firmicutes) TaxID=185979 RepID=UPI0008F0621F|nr:MULTISPECIES: hypothetical protein [unclassified Bacillus (in: firmicutes)]SFI31779.1 hypothetical protein SAMN04488574_102320 [Bacillus sp. 71mf]SFS37525.1 hypothetical protein SAMN04488145_101145 [Bacillus sp. 103mf]